MHVLVDANVLVSDPWQEGKKTRALLDFLQKTRATMLVHEVTWEEVRETMRRRWGSSLAAYDSTARELSRLRICDIAELERDALLEDVTLRWWNAVRKPYALKQAIPLDNALLPEIVRRATGRVPPCARNGEEFRDALMWVGALEYCKAKSARYLAFISSNTRDFAASDGVLLPELRRDAADRGIALDYYRSVDEFLKEHADPIEWLTLEWASAHVDEQELREVLWDVVQGTSSTEFDLRWRLGKL
jgi:hypothetical protein